MRSISDGSCDAEGWSNDAKNPALPSLDYINNNWMCFKIYSNVILNYNNIFYSIKAFKYIQPWWVWENSFKKLIKKTILKTPKFVCKLELVFPKRCLLRPAYICDYVCQTLAVVTAALPWAVYYDEEWPWGDSSLLLFSGIGFTWRIYSGHNLSGSGSLMATDAVSSVLKDPQI